MNDVFSRQLERLPLIAILRGITPVEAAAIGRVLVEAGFGLIEVPLNSPDPLESIHVLADALGPDVLVGAGTVLAAAEVQHVAQAGGRLIVSPNTNAEVIRAAKSAGLVALPGIATPSEALSALEAGADALKLFPAEMMPPAIVKALRAVLPPDTRLIPVGGVTPENMRPYLDAGAAGFGIGSALYKPGMTEDAVAQAARRFAAACAPTA